MQADALVNYGPLLLQGHHGIGQLGNPSRIHGHILIGRELLLHTLRRQHSGLAHHGVHRGDGTPVIQGDTGRAHCRQGNEDGCHQAYCDLLADTLHLSAPQFFHN